MTEPAISDPKLSLIYGRLEKRSIFATTLLLVLTLGLIAAREFNRLWGVGTIITALLAAGAQLVILAQVGLAFWRRRWIRVLVGLGAFAVLAVAASVARDTSDLSHRQSQQRGDVVARALSAYRHQDGAWPDQLRALIPRYLTEIPNPEFHERGFFYRRDLPNDDFVLGYHGPFLTTCTRSKSTSWHCGG